LQRTLENAHSSGVHLSTFVALFMKPAGSSNRESLLYTTCIQARFEVFTSVNTEVVVFWVVTPCRPWRWRHHGPPKRWNPTTSLPI